MAVSRGPGTRRLKGTPMFTKQNNAPPVKTVHNAAVVKHDGTINTYRGEAYSLMRAGTAVPGDVVNLCLSNPRLAL